MTTYFQRVSNATDVNKLGLSYVDKQFDIQHFSLFIVASVGISLRGLDFA